MVHEMYANLYAVKLTKFKIGLKIGFVTMHDA